MTPSAHNEASPDVDAKALAALHDLDVLDSAPEPEFDALVRVAALACGMPIALVSLIDADRQWFKANLGLADVAETPRDWAFCAHTVRGLDVLEVEDAALDARFRDNPLVVDGPRIRFYAGAPLVLDGGHAVGTICVIDREPHRLAPAQRDVLRQLARVASRALEGRRALRREHDVALALVTVSSTVARAEEEQRFLIDNLMAGVVVHGPDGTLLRSNPRACALLGLTEDQMRGKQLIDPAWRFLRSDGSTMPLDEYPVARVLASGAGIRDYVVGVMCNDRDRPTWLIGDANPQFDAGGGLVQVVVTFVDITSLVEMRTTLERSERRFSALFRSALDGIIVGRPDGSVLSANPAACAMLGLDEAGIRARGRAGVVAPESTGLAPMLAERARTGHALGELLLVRGSGERFTAEVSSTIFQDPDGEPMSSIFFRDITQRKDAEDLARRLAHFDDLTALPNRRQLLDKLRQSLASSAKGNRHGALVFVDLDNFKQVNDARGHWVGDALLQAVSRRLLQCIKPEDTLARIGGDEFIVLLNDLGGDVESASRHALLVAERLRSALEQDFDIDGHHYSSTGSFGIALFPREAHGADDVLREADIAMYRAKSAGRNRIAFFESSMQAEVEERLLLEQDLSEAIRTHAIEAYIQPQFNAKGVQTGGEVLARWNHPTRGTVPPVQFIPIAEQTGLIVPLGEWILRQAALTLRALQERGDHRVVSVNVSPRQFLHEHFVEHVADLLAEAGIPGTKLIFEVTEGLLIKDWEEVQHRVLALGGMGIRLSIDDFGTGYSSLAYLKRLPLYELKIDRAFVADLPIDANDVAIVESILSMARNFGLHVVAEGVETQRQADFLVARGCQGLQGYLFGRPVPLADWMAATAGLGAR